MKKDLKRLLFLSCFVLFLFSLLIISFYKLQIDQGNDWSKKADNQHFMIVKEPAKRGFFFANSEVKKSHPFLLQSFVIDIEKYHLHIDPLSIPPSSKTFLIHWLTDFFSLDKEKKKELELAFSKKSRDRKLFSWLNLTDKEKIEAFWFPYAKEHKLAKNALFFVTDYQRSYPFGAMLGQVLHTLQQTQEGSGGPLPTGGLEWQFHSYLQGKDGKRKLKRSLKNSFETREIISLPENGADIYLTINPFLQAIVEEELQKGVKHFGAKAGWAVMMDPKTGEILALGQYPFFSLKNYSVYFNDKEKIKDTKVKAITDALEPGSVMKPITAAIALMANDELIKQGKKPLFDPEEKVATANGIFPGRKKPIKDVSFHSYLNLYMAVQKSSNIYFSRLVERIIHTMGKDWYRKKLTETFGFGKKTDIELPAETTGVVPRPGKKHPNGRPEWSTPTPFSLAIGYNLQANTLQLLRSFSIFANGGYLVKPTLIKKIMKKTSDGNFVILFDSSKREKFSQVLPASIAKEILTCLQFVTTKHGSGKKAQISGFTEFGKSSTEEKLIHGRYVKNEHYATFLGGVLVDDPPFLLAVVLDDPAYRFLPGVGGMHYGGASSAKIFKRITSKTLEYLGLSSDDPYGYPINDPRYEKGRSKMDQMSDQLQEMYEKWNKNKE